MLLVFEELQVHNSTVQTHKNMYDIAFNIDVTSIFNFFFKFNSVEFQHAIVISVFLEIFVKYNNLFLAYVVPIQHNTETAKRMNSVMEVRRFIIV